MPYFVQCCHGDAHMANVIPIGEAHEPPILQEFNTDMETCAFDTFFTSCLSKKSIGATQNSKNSAT